MKIEEGQRKLISTLAIALLATIVIVVMMFKSPQMVDSYLQYYFGLLGLDTLAYKVANLKERSLTQKGGGK